MEIRKLNKEMDTQTALTRELAKAKELNIPIISEDAFISRCGK